jgi:glycosyltransferase involved in cell wall biosynthesis
MTIRFVVSDLFSGDAIGNFVLAVRSMLERQGLPTAVYAERFDEGLKGVKPYGDFFKDVRLNDTLFYQLSNCDPAWPELMKAPCRRIVYYHNITPGHFFAPYSPETAALLDAGRNCLALICSSHTVLSNSRYSLAEVEPFLSPEVERRVFPPFLKGKISPSPSLDTPSPPKDQYLLVLGRVVPHKRVEEAIKIFACVREKIPALRLVIAGSQYEPYQEKLQALISADRTLTEAVAFTGPLAAEQISSLLSKASGLMHTSAHEGFCMPLLEAMLAKIPVFAHGQPAVKETLGGVGVVFDAGLPWEAAERILNILNDPQKRSSLVEAQSRRAEALLGQADGKVLSGILENSAGSPTP